MVIRRLRVLKFVDVFIERLFPLGRAPQLEQQMLEREVCRNRAAIVGRVRFGTRIATE
jgi:hypothetical protein